MRFGELFAGISGFGLGFEQAGMKCVWQVELDADCNRVLERHYPDVQRIRDVKEAGKHNLGPVDVIAFGWPCQDLSVAGLRAGISGERSGLFHEAARIIQELRPKWIVAENVPGLLSSYTPIDAPPDGVEVGTEWEVEEDSDFERVLATLDELGYCVSWRVCDAQFWSVAQRRERVFIVGSLGNLGSLEVFPFAESLPGDFETRGEARAGVTATVRGGTASGRGACDEVMDNLQVAMPLKAKANSSHDESHETYVTHALRSEGADASEDGTGRGTPLVCATLNSGGNNAGFRTEPGEHLVPGAYRTAGNCGPFEQGDKTAALNTATDPNQNIIAFSSKDHGADAGEIAPTLRSQNFKDSHINGGGQVAIAFAENQRGELRTSDISPQLSCAGGKPGSGYPATAGQFGVRRPTPTECMRLQGFPDWWFDDENGKKLLSDSAMYRCLGNAVCVSVARWIGTRILEAESLKVDQ